MNNTRLVFLFILTAFVSCNSKDSAESTQAETIDFSYELDTVMVDAGDQFIHLNWQVTTSDLSDDGQLFYNFKTGANEPGLEVIDLENLKLERVIPMSLDGPNAIRSPYVSNVYMLPDGTFYLSDSYEFYHFDQEGNKLSTMVYAKQEFEGEKLEDGMRIKLNETLSRDRKTILNLYGKEQMEEMPEGFALFDLENQIVKYLPTDLFKELDKYKTVLYFDGSEYASSMGMAQIHLSLQNDSIIYSNSVQNKVYFYHLKTDSLTSKDFSSSITSKEAKANYAKRSETMEDFQEISKEKDKEVMYGHLFFDDQNDVYWRFAKEMDRMKGDTVLYKTVLTAFNPAFNQLHEVLLPSDFVLPYEYFAREGMIYTFLNIDDELAFVRLKPIISYE
ncbi:DUF4221 family protein [Algoriphagus sp. D3-2-R+10]|uniref:DUF4221 family protein n=1 Tax=Algoriphagus aurantiacus TaxID=3103948 RepID=UPI002B3ECC67|nr:DUF4221 family protein [Algoriphagus sp. D3-2-R+10]MEB2776588.1 DUF4221 family protein [Algoriphagus sp. D3-2-R+10]